MSLTIMSLREPSPLARSRSWTRDLIRRNKSPNDADMTASVKPIAQDREKETRSNSLTVPDVRPGSRGSGDSRSTQSSTSRGRSLSKLLRRDRSPSNAMDAAKSIIPKNELDFNDIHSWFLGFQRYNLLVTTQLSRNEIPMDVASKLLGDLGNKCESRMIHGLPEPVFDLGLLWCPAQPGSRRLSDEPSWTWMGWEGQVNFPFDPISCPDLPKETRFRFKSEIARYQLGDETGYYNINRDREEKVSPNLKIDYPWSFSVPGNFKPDEHARTLRFPASTIRADGFTVSQIRHGDKDVPCCKLTNSNSEHCGVIMDFESSLPDLDSASQYDFVLVSRNLRYEPSTTEALDPVPTLYTPGTPIWDGERYVRGESVKDFDETVFNPGEWSMMNVMLIKWSGEHAERVAVGRIHEDAWKQLDPVTKNIVLE